MRILRRFLSLPIRDQRLLVCAIVLLSFFKFALRLFSLKTLLFFSARVFSRFGGPQPQTQQIASRVAWAVSAVTGRIPALANCLAMALTAKFLLAIWGCSSVLEIGVTKSASGRFMAHAWLKSDGKMLIGLPKRNDYSALARFGGETT